MPECFEDNVEWFEVPTLAFLPFPTELVELRERAVIDDWRG